MGEQAAWFFVWIPRKEEEKRLIQVEKEKQIEAARLQEEEELKVREEARIKEEEEKVKEEATSFLFALFQELFKFPVSV